MTAAKKTRKPAPFKLTMPEISETSRMYAILEYANYHPKVAWMHRFNVGGANFKDGRGSDRYVKFGFAGLSDLLGQMRDGRLIVIECKARLGRATADQIAFLLHVQKHNGLAGIARTIEDVKAIIEGRIYDPEIHK